MSSSGFQHVAERAEAMQPFLAMEVMERAFAMERAGARVAHLEIGEPEFRAPKVVVDACVQALVAGETRYSDSRGLMELREAIARDTDRRFGVEVAPERVIVSSGTSPAMLMVFSLLVDPGDEVVLGTPHYPCYPNFIRYCSGVPVTVPTDARSGYQLEAAAVREVITPRTRAIVVGSPANPTGAVQHAETLRGLTGFRLGYAIAPEWALRRLQIMGQNLFISPNRFVQHAGIAALEHGGDAVKEMRAAYQKRRDLIVEGLRGLGFGILTLPEGAFYVLADARRFGADSLALAFELLERAHVGTTPGVDFGAAGEGMLRFCYAASEETIERALESLAQILPELEERCAGAGSESRRT
jgi:aspartate/methionine/tyrosine aminotransferase